MSKISHLLSYNIKKWERESLYSKAFFYHVTPFGLKNYNKTLRLQEKKGNEEFAEFIVSKGVKGKILDIGCGLGFFLKRCDELGLETYGVDISPIEVKEKLGRKYQLLNNDKIISLTNSTYNKLKYKYKLNPRDSRWNHIMNAMIALDLLDKKEKEFWIIKYSSLELDEDQPKFPQTWNRIWLFRSFNIYDITDLKLKIAEYNLNLSYVEGNVCGYVPQLKVLKEEDGGGGSKEYISINDRVHKNILMQIFFYA